MRKTLLILLIVLLAVSITGLVLFSNVEFGNGKGHGAQDTQNLQSSRITGWLIIIVPLVVALGVVAYTVAFPEIKKGATSQTGEQQDGNKQALNAVLKVLNEDERKVVEVVANSEKGMLLQNEIRWKTNLSRVKTHRVIARLSSRGIIQVEKHANTNKVTLAKWISKNEK
jgi:uncharacterized membrane protein